MAQGRAQAARGDLAAAGASLAAAARLAPELPGVWRALGDVRHALGDAKGADAAHRRHVETAIADPELMAAAQALAANRLDVAEAGLRARLRAEPTDVAALRMLGELAARLGRLADAEALLAHALEIAPGFLAARHNLAGVLHRQGRGEAALAETLKLRAAEPTEPAYRVLEAAVRALVGDYALSLQLYEDLIAGGAAGARLHLSYGHALKTVGRRDEAMAAYRRCLASGRAADGDLAGETWWSLANLKTDVFTAADRAAMATAALDPATSEDGRLHLHYALGKALEDAGDSAGGFEHYARGAAIARRRSGYDAAQTTAQARRMRAAIQPSLMSARAGQGCPARDPIFIVGLPRSGSTLVEQILASHPQVEGTMELAELPVLVRGVGGEAQDGYPEALARLSASELRRLGEDYLARTRIYRKTARPLFIDKMPNNWLHVGLIRLILPNARIIDARRHPMATCFSAFKQHFARGQYFTYDLEDLGRYYRDYVDLMDHIDEAAPEVVHRVIYEDMVADTEAQVRALLAHCGLPFHPACLRFHETRRAVRTASSEQVRRPIYREGLDHWRAFEAQLEPLKHALGPALESWRGVQAPP